MLTTIEQLEAIYGVPHARALCKEIAFLNADYRAFVEASPLVILSSVGPEGTDCSPKGDRPGFVRVVDARTLAIPDRPGNNRIDNLRNILADGRVSLLFLVPGVGEMLRVNGRAHISAEPGLCASFAVEGRPPRTVIVVSIAAAYFHCAKAVIRAGLWDPSRHTDHPALPSPGAMHQRLSEGRIDGAAYDRDLPARTAASLY